MSMKDNILVRLRKLEHAVFNNEGIGGNEYSSVTISSPITATNGALTDEDIHFLNDVTCVISWGEKVYRLRDDHTDTGYKVYAYHNGEYFEFITVTLSTGGWVLTKEV